MLTMSTNNRVGCTYSTCGRFFKSTEEMQSHKANADKHYYCTKCDMDFVNHALLHLHKVMSEHHFACLECDMELRSNAGLQHHVKLTHSQGKDVSCLGCDRKYKSAAAVMKHIEENKCPVLSLPDRITHDTTLEGAAGKVFLTLGLGPSHTRRPGDISDDDSDGGVAVNSKRRTSRPATAHQFNADLEDWPKLGSVGASRAKPSSISTESTGGAPLGFTRSLLDDDIPMMCRIKSSSPPAEDEDPTAFDAEDEFSDEEDPRPNAHATDTIISPTDFWDPVRERYVCNCKAVFANLSSFASHIAAEDDSILDCPRCGKRFKTRVAHVAHVEAPFSKCAVRASSAVLDQELSDITRGFAEIKGNDQQVLLDDMMEGSSSSTLTSREPSCGQRLDSKPESDTKRFEDMPAESSADDSSLGGMPDYIAEDLGDDALDSTLARDMKGLVFSAKQRGDEKIKKY
ncbi:unnamed protein product [Penicillium olsonii]|nr:unnamed protein product [Penicillium olsonii]CAG7930682.1 unnamed protein product [Penicillium olsonii]